MKLPRNLSGTDLVKVLKKRYGWEVHGREGSHVTLKKENEHLILTVPLHTQLDPGTLLAILRKANTLYDDIFPKNPTSLEKINF